MAKRGANKQITKDGIYDDQSSSDDESQGYAVAAPDVIAKRQIAVPKKRLTSGINALSSNPFGGLGSKPFSSLGGGLGSAGPVNPFGNTVAAPEQTTSTRSNGELRLRALNAKFTSIISKANIESPLSNWTKMCEQYIDYAKNLDKTQPLLQAKTAAANPVATVNSAPKPAVTLKKDDIPDIFKNPPPPPPWDDEEPKEPKNKSEITPSGFKFAGMDTASATSFQFGDKKVDMKGPSNHASKPSGGFIFNPNGSGEIKQAENKRDSTSDEKSTSDSKISSGNPGSATPFVFGALKTGREPDAADDKSSQQKPIKTPEEKPTFSFMKPSNDNKEGEKALPKPAFKFGSSKDSKTIPTFSFGKPSGKEDSSIPKASPTFGSSGDTKKDDAFKPSFNFGSKSNDDQSTPKLTFGTPSNANKLSFGTGVNPFGSAPVLTSQGESGNTTLGTAKPAWNQSEAVVIVHGDKNSTENPAADGPKDEMVDPQTDLSGPGPGEEDEDNVYEKKSKAYELVNGELKSIGLGLLRVLVHKETKKARLLLRADPSGRVLLNIAIREPFSYKATGKTVRVLDVKPGESKPTNYTLMVKTPEDASALADKLMDVRQ